MAENKKSIAVYCGHKFGNNPTYKTEAEKMGRLIGENGIRLVYGGGNVGLMGTVANAAKTAGGEVIGITTQNILNLQEPLLEGIQSEIENNLSKRKQRMFDLSDAFCILPGGLGTLDELVEIMVMHQIKESHKPIYFLNTNGYWNMFGNIMAYMQKEGFLGDVTQFNMQVLEQPEDVIKIYKTRFWEK
ncbi:MAG: TIGR00730 family Rossman fold protein [Alphaproteobacteria bacterium]|nr:TIGR00730 family Rossman fold protein [Alphaproteobacteria bacterium]